MPDYFNELIKEAKKKKGTQTIEGIPGKIEQLKEEIKETEKQLDPKKAEKEKEEKEQEENRENEQLPDGKIIESYGKSSIYKLKDKPLLHYVTPSARPTETEKTIVNTIKEAATRLITIAPFKIRDLQERKNAYFQKVMEILQNSPQLRIPQRRFEFYAEQVVREMVGYGPIDPLVNDDRIEEIMVIGPKLPVYIFHRQYEMMTTNIQFFSDQEVIDLVNRIARQIGRRIDISTPMLDARLSDGSRVNATIPPASVDSSTLTIRKFRKDPYSIVDLINSGTISTNVGAFLWVCVDGMGTKPANMLISGGTGSGKTTSLNALAAFVPPYERIISIEDIAELNLPLTHWIRLEGKPPGLEGKGEITLDILTKNSLRMRPDRIIVGEIRHQEAFTLFTAMNTGHEGMLSPETLIQLSDGSIKEIEGFCKEYFEKNNSKSVKDMQFVEISGEKPKIIALNKQTLGQEQAEVNAVWKRECKKSRQIKLTSGKEISLSFDHPVFRIEHGFLEQVQAQECNEGDYLCVANKMDIGGETFDEKYAYFIGLLLGDGHLRKYTMLFENKNEKMQEIFRELSTELFKKTPKTTKRKDGRMTSVMHSKQIALEIHEKFEVPFGNKTKIVNIPKKIEQADNKCIAAFLRGMFDTDGHVSDIRKSICLSTSNKNVIKKTPLLLKRFGVQCRTSFQKKDGKGHYGPYYRLFITGKANLENFRNEIGFGHPKKETTLKKISQGKENTNVDIIPGTSRLIKMTRTALDLTQKELASKSGFGLTRTLINAYEVNARNPSRNALKKINEVLAEEFNKKIKKLNETNMTEIIKKINSAQSTSSAKMGIGFAKEFSSVEEIGKKSGLGKKLLYYYAKKGNLSPSQKERICNALNQIYENKMSAMRQAREIITHFNSITSKNIMWDKIKSITEKDEKTEYFDLTLDKFHTFVANGLVVSNCMGTIHANSSFETVVRVISPPMEVPEVMLSGLDLILVEHRIHDKKKGTIRRITEIAEVTGVLEKKTKTVPLYEYDPAADTLKRTKNESNYIKTLARFLGKNPEFVEKTISKREKFLKELIENETRLLAEVSSKCLAFVQNEKE